MGTALGGRDQVDVAFLYRVATFWQPQQRPIHRFLITGQAAAERLVRQALEFADRIHQVGTQAVFVMPFDFLAGGLVFKADQQPRAQHGLGLEHVLEAADGEFRGVEVFRIRREEHAGAGVALADRTDDFQLGGLVAILEGHLVFVAVTLYPHPHFGGQGVDHGNTHPVQTAGELVVLVGKLATGMKLGEDQLDARNTFLGVNVHRHATAVIADFQGMVGMQDHLYR
ncbi:hypothetical protein D3C85_1166700 [compost metagenome]